MNGSIFVIGGTMDGQPKPVKPTGLVERYDPNTQEWEPMPNLQIPRTSLAVGVRNGKIYVIGGVTENRQITSAIEELDLSSLELSLSVTPTDKLPTTWGEVKITQ